MHPKPSVAAIRGLKGQRQVLMMHVDTAAEAAAAADAGIEMFTCEVDAKLPAFVPLRQESSSRRVRGRGSCLVPKRRNCARE